MLVKAGQPVEDGAFADVRISRQCDGNFIIHTDAPIHNCSLMIRYERRRRKVPGLLGKNHAAGNHSPRIPRGLAGKIIPVGMEDDRTSDDVGIGVSAPHPCQRLGLIVGKLVNECEAGSWLLSGVHDG